MNTYYKIEGTPNSPVLVLSNSLGTNLHMWDDIISFLLPYFRILRYDTRGLGKSEVTPDPYDVELLGKDVIDLLDKLGIEKAHFCGLSMGGQIGQYLGIHYPNRLEKLILSNTAAKIGEKKTWDERIENIGRNGLEELWQNTQKVWFTSSFIQSNPEKIADLGSMFGSNKILGYSNCCASVRDADFINNINKIPVETLIIAGNEDPVTTIADAEFMVGKIPKATLAVLPSKHIPSVEQPELFAEALINFLVGSDVFERGMHVRRSVLGNDHVDRANVNRNSFTEDFQNFISHYAWGEIWTRPGLNKHNRSLITLSMMIALNRRNEFKMHVKAAINNGVSIDEIKEVILQSGIYCGLPAANDAFHAASEVLNELNILDE